MRPQIRSLPLCKVECPQFSWAVRNNSENVSEVLQPDLHQNVLIGDHERNRIAPLKSCYCLDDKLRPTLFPHPVSCVCSSEPYPPKNEKYRYCKLNMHHAIGDVMEEIIMESLPTSLPSPAPRPEKLMKKIMRSSYISDEVDLTDENACVECLAKDPALLKDLLDNMKYKRGIQDHKDDGKFCMEAGDCKKRTKVKDVGDCSGDSSPIEPERREDKLCKWKKDTICTCKELRHDLYADCEKCRCKCPKTCSKCRSNKGESPKFVDIPMRNVEHPLEERKGENKVVEKKVAGKVMEKKAEKKVAEKKVEKKVTEKKIEEKVVKTKKNPKKIPKEKGIVETKVQPPIASPHVSRAKKPKVKSPRMSREKSPQKTNKWQRPNNIICERLDLIEKQPFNHMQETEISQTKETSPVQIYEHFRAVRSGSSRSASEQTESIAGPKCTNTRKNLISNSMSSTKNLNRTRVKHKKPVKMPWNWHNQPNVEDPYKSWGGTRYSWSKKLNYAELGKKMEENNEKLNRSRDGDDELKKSDIEAPRYYEYKPNLRHKSFKHSILAYNEKEINRKEQRRYRNGYGRMRVKTWQQALEKNTRTNGKQNKELPKEVQEESYEDDSEESNLESMEEEDHDKKQCLQCLMSDVQERFIGPSKNLCQHETKKDDKSSSKVVIDPTQAKTLENADVINEDPRNIDDTPERRLPTILEENTGRCGWRSDGSVEMNRQHRVEKGDGQLCPEKVKERPNTVVVPLEDSPRNPFFSVIKQRIHSRGKTLENLNGFRNEHFPKQTVGEHTCVHRFTIDDRLFPKPLHCDESGTSCCVHCDKPMTISEKSVFLDQRESKERVSEKTDIQKKQVSKFSLRQKPVHIGAKNSVMEIRLRPEHDALLKGYGRERGWKREFYTNSLALRHQWR